MEYEITVSANNKEELNKIIDSKLKEGYLIMGEVDKDKQGQLNQLMVLPQNIDSELTVLGAVKLVIFVIIYATIIYFLV